MEHKKQAIKNVLDIHLNNYWNSVSDGKKDTVASEILEALSLFDVSKSDCINPYLLSGDELEDAANARKIGK